MLSFSDTEIIKGCLNGQKEMFSELVERYHRPIYSYVYARINDKHTAEDVVQDIFLAAYSSLGKLEDHSRFSGWLFGIAKNKTLVWQRDHKYSEKRVRTGVEIEIAFPEPIDDVYQQKLNQLRNALQGLKKGPSPDESRYVRMSARPIISRIDRILQHRLRKDLEAFQNGSFDGVFQQSKRPADEFLGWGHDVRRPRFGPLMRMKNRFF